MKNLRKILRQNVATLPKQSLTGLKVALGIRAQYAAIASIGLLMLTQVLGAVIFTGNSLASTNVSFVKSIPGSNPPPHVFTQISSIDSGGITEGLDNYLYAVVGQTVYKFSIDGTYLSTITLSVGVQSAGIAVDSLGNMFILENGNGGGYQNSVRKYDRTGVYQGRVTGQYWFGQIWDIHIDASDNLYVSGDIGTRKYNSAGLQVGAWSTGGSRFAVSGQYVYITSYGSSYVTRLDTNSGDTLVFGGEGAAPGQMSSAGGIDVDVNGDIYVNDKGNDRVEVFHADGTYSRLFGSSGSGDGQFLTSQHARQNTVKILSNGNVLVSDESNNRVQVFTTSGEYVRELRDAFAMPAAMVIGKSGSMYVVDSGNSRIKKINLATGATITTWGSYGTAEGQFKFDDYQYQSFTGIAVDASENVYVADTLNHRIQKFSSSGEFIAAWGSEGTDVGQFGNVVSIAIDSHSDVYTLEKGYPINRVQKFNSYGGDAQQIGSGSQIHEVSALAIDSSDSVYVKDKDAGVYSLRVFNSNGSFNRSISLHYAFGFSGGVNNEFASMAFDARGNLIIGNYNGIDVPYGRVYKLHTVSDSLQPEILSGIGVGTADGQVRKVNGIATDWAGNIYISDYDGRIQQFYDPDGSQLTVTTASPTALTESSVTLHGTTDLSSTVTARGIQYGTTTSYGTTVEDTSSPSIAYAGQWGTYGPGASQFDDPRASAIGPDGNLYIANLNNNRIDKFKLDGTYISSIGTEGSGNGELDGPSGLAFDSLGNMYVTERDNERVQKFDSSGHYVTKWGSIESGLFNYPSDVAIDSSGNVYVADYNNPQIKKFTSDGVLLASWNTYGVSNNQYLLGPSAITIDSNDRLHVVDYDADKIITYTTAGAYVSEFGSYGYGDYNLVEPSSINFDRDGNQYITQYAGNVKKYDANGTYIGSIGSYGSTDGHFVRPIDMAIDPSNNLYVLDNGNNRVQKFGASIQADLSGLACDTVYHYRAYATDATGTVYGEDQPFLTSPCPAEFAITTTTLPDGVVGQSYSQSIQVENSSGPVSYSFVSGSVPPGLTIDSDQAGAIAGTPTAAGTYTFTIEASSGASSDAQEYTMTVTEADIPMTITTDTLPMGYTGQPYSAAIETAHAHGDRTFTSIADALPDGLELNASTGEITGTPASWTGGRYYNLRIEVTDGVTTIYQGYSLYIEEVGTVYICDSDYNETLRLNRQFSRSICTSGGLGYKTFEVVSGSLPPGLSLDAISGEISGAATQVGDYDAVIRVSDLSGSDENAFHWHVIPDPEPKANTPIVTITSPTNNAVFDYKHDTVVVSGTGPANQTIATYMDGYQLGTADVDDGGNWSYKVSNVFPGNHAFDAKWVPSGDIAFVPYYDINSFNSNIYSIDTASKQLIAIYHLPSYCRAVSAVINHAGNKLYVSGIDQSVFKPAIWEYDISSGELTGHMLLDDPEGFYSGMAVSDDDHYIYAKKNSLNDGSSGENAPARYHKIDIKTMSYAGALPDLTPINRRTGLSMVKPVLAAGYLYSTDSVTDGNDPYTISAINIINQSITSIGTINGAARLDSLPQIAIADYIYASVNDRLVVIDPGTNMVTKELSIPGIQENHDSSDDMVVSMAIDTAHQKAYLVTYLRKLYVVDITSGDVTSYEVSPEEVINDYSQSLLNSATLSSDGSHLYIVDLGFGKIRSFNISAQAFESAISGLLPVDRMGYIANGDYIGRIAPPTANISFSVGAAPIRPTIEPKPKPEPQSTPPTTTLETHQPIITKEAPVPSPVTTPKGVVFAQNSLFALVRRIPEPIAIGFPWLLLLLALILVVIQYYHVHFEAIATKNLQQALAAQQRLVEEQDNFVALTTHYLHTPLTVMEGEISLMLKTGTISQEHANKLNAALAGLSAEAESVLAQEEHDEVK